MTSPLKSDLFTDKPISLSVKEYLIRRLAVKMMTSEKTIEAVVNHQFQSAQQAMAIGNRSLEISGFGKFLFNEKKAQKKWEKYHSQKTLFENMLEDQTLTEARRKNLSMKLQSAIDNIRDLKPRIHGNSISDLRGVAEQFDSTQGVEEDNKADQ